MASSDVFTISALLVLIVGAVCFYLYTRIKQVEKKVALVEGILLDLKTATEASFMDFPAASSYMLAKDFGEDDDEDDDENHGGNGLEQDDSGVEELPFVPFTGSTDVLEPLDEVEPGGSNEPVAAAAAAPAAPSVVVNKVDDHDAYTPDLESLTAKELMAIARSKGLNVSKAMRKQQLIDLINSASTHVEPETSTTLEQSDELDGLAADSTLLSGTTLDSAPF